MPKKTGCSAPHRDGQGARGLYGSLGPAEVGVRLPEVIVSAKVAPSWTRTIVPSAIREAAPSARRWAISIWMRQYLLNATFRPPDTSVIRSLLTSLVGSS